MYIFPEYEKNYNNCFWYDYENIDYYSFQVKISALENNFKKLCEARDILINQRKVDKETKKWAKQFMTPEIKEYLAKANIEKQKNMAISTMINIDNAFKNIIMKRKRGEE